MKILLINHYAIPPVEAGGTRHYSLARELIAKGHNVHIVAANFSHQTKTVIAPQIKAPVFEQFYDNVPFILVNVPTYNDNSIARIKNMLWFSKQLLNNPYFKKMEVPDVVIGSSPHPFAAWMAQRLAAKWEIPFLLEVRDLWPQTLIDLNRLSPRHPVAKLLAVLEKYLYNKSQKIITLLPGAHEYIKEVGINPDKVVWIPNGIDFSLYSQDIENVDNNKFIVMYAGAHGLLNGLDTIVKSAEILNKDYGDKIAFCLVGDGPHKSSLMKYATDKQLNNIYFVDPVPKCQIPKMLGQASVFIVVVRDSPLYKYGISLNKIYDYLASSRPIVIGLNAYNNPVEEASAGITVPPENPEELAKAVLKIYNMTYWEREQMGRNGRQYVEKNHDFKNLASKLEKVIIETMANFKICQ